MPVTYDIELHHKERERGRIVRHRNYTNEEITQLIALAMYKSVAWMTTYPPPTDRNSPPTPWWERGRGLHSGRGIIQDSYVLGHEGSDEPNDNWYFPATVVEDGVTVQAQMRPEAPYLAYVIGSDTQAMWHEGRWRTVTEAAAWASEYINTEGRRTLLRRLQMRWDDSSER